MKKFNMPMSEKEKRMVRECSESPTTLAKQQAADPRLVIEAMREKKLLDDFLFYLSKNQFTTWIPVHLIMDRTGKLARLALEWIRRETKRDDKK